jgi:hypothetical protein
MTTAFSQIVGAVIAALEAAPPVCTTIYRARSNVVPDSLDQAVSVQWDQTSAQPAAIMGAPKDWETRLTVECYASTRSARESGDIAVDPLLEAVYTRLAQDTTLGGLIEDLNIVGIEAENSAEGKKTGWVRLTYIAMHRTTNTSLS